MSNTMEIDNIECVNSMNTLSFHWVAKFSSGDELFQFSNNKENKFEEVQKRFDELQYFSLYSKNSYKKFTVDLIKGRILFSQSLEAEDNLLKEDNEKIKNNIRLIVFRRHRLEIGSSDLKEESNKIWYFLGYQYNDLEGKNNKVLLQIDSEGNFSIGE